MVVKQKSAQEALPAATRTEFGKGASRRDRRQGLVPAVLYGSGKETLHLNLPSRELAAILRSHGTNAVVNLNFDGKNQLALTKQITVHPIRGYIEHVDLQAVRKGEKIAVEVPIVIVGTPAAGTSVNHEINTIEVLADALSIPEEIEVSVAGLEAGAHVLASDIILPQGVSLIGEDDELIVNVTVPHTADLGESETTAEDAAETAQ